MRTPFLTATLLLVGCPPSSDKTDDSGTDDTGTGACSGMDCYIYVTEPYVGDTTCYTGAWMEPVVGAGCTEQITINGLVQDFQDEVPVPDASLELWANDDIYSTPSFEGTADSSGTINVPVPACTPIAYRTFTPEDWNLTRDTYEVHQVYEWDASGTSSEIFNSVSVTTSQIIPALIGLTWDHTTTAVVAGTAYDCNEDGIANAQVYIHDASGNPPPANDANPFGVFYFSNGLPASTAAQPWTNDDGLWVGVNVPSGTWTADLYMWDGATHVLYGSTTLDLEAGAVYVSNIYTGVGDGIGYPPACLATCE